MRLIKCVVGIDPGLNGGLAMIQVGSSRATAIAMPAFNVGGKRRIDFSTAVGFCMGASVIAMEIPGLRPKEGGVSTRTTFSNYARMLGRIEERYKGAAIIEVDPKAWQRAVYGFSTPNKLMGVDRCKQDYPGLNLMATPRSRVPHTGITDAVMIAKYAEQFYMEMANGQHK